MKIIDFEKEKRRLEIQMAKAVNLLGADPLTEEEEKLFDRYVNGEIDYEELGEIIKKNFCE